MQASGEPSQEKPLGLACLSPQPPVPLRPRCPARAAGMRPPPAATSPRVALAFPCPLFAACYLWPSSSHGLSGCLEGGQASPPRSPHSRVIPIAPLPTLAGHQDGGTHAPTPPLLPPGPSVHPGSCWPVLPHFTLCLLWKLRRRRSPGETDRTGPAGSDVHQVD